MLPVPSLPAIPPVPPVPPVPLEHLHPALWRAHQLGHGAGRVEPSGYAVLDAELPGGGWPQRALTELLLAGPGGGEIRLLAPALAHITAAGRGLLLLGPPAEPCGAALQQLGIALSQCVIVRGPDLLWPLEQALRSGQVGAVLAWPGPALRAEALRRLQLAAQSHEGPAFLVRGLAAAAQPSAAPLRLALHGAGPDALAVRLLKRRGPALGHALWLNLPPVLSRAARERALQPRPVFDGAAAVAGAAGVVATALPQAAGGPGDARRLRGRGLPLACRNPWRPGDVAAWVLRRVPVPVPAAGPSASLPDPDPDPAPASPCSGSESTCRTCRSNRSWRPGRGAPPAPSRRSRCCSASACAR